MAGPDRDSQWLAEAQARADAEDQNARATADRERRFKLRDRRSEISAPEDVAAGAMRGLAKTGTSTIRGLGWLTQKVTGGRAGAGAMRFADEADQDVEEYTGARSGDERYDVGTAGTLGEVAGRLTGEAATTIAGGGLVRSGLRALSTAPLAGGIPEAAGAVTRVLDRLGRGGAAARTAANSLPFLPVDVVQGAGGAPTDEQGNASGFVLPGRAGAALENVAMGAIPTYAIEKGLDVARGVHQTRIFDDALARAKSRAEPYQYAKSTAEGRVPEPPPGPEPMRALPPGQYDMPAVQEPITDPRRLLTASRQPIPIAEGERAGPGIPQPAVPRTDAEMFGPDVVPPARRLQRGPLVTPPPVSPDDALDAARLWARDRQGARAAAGQSDFDMEDFIARRRGEPTAAEVERAAMQEEPVAPAEDFPFGFGPDPDGGGYPRSGAMRHTVATTLGGGAAGGTAGAMIGDTPEERRRNAALGFMAGSAAGAVGGTVLSRITRAAEESRLANAERARWRTMPMEDIVRIGQENAERAGVTKTFGEDMLTAIEDDSPAMRNRTGAVGPSQPQGAEGGRPWLQAEPDGTPKSGGEFRLPEHMRKGYDAEATDADILEEELISTSMWDRTPTQGMLDAQDAVPSFVEGFLQSGKPVEKLHAAAQAYANESLSGGAKRAFMDSVKSFRDKVRSVPVETARVGEAVASTPVSPVPLPADVPPEIPPRTGGIAPAIATSVGGAGAGGVAGSMVGDTPEERKRNALFGVVAGGVAGAGASRLLARAGKAAAAASTPALARAAESVAMGERASGKGASFLTNAEKAYTDIVDETFPLSKFGRLADKANPERLAETVAMGQGWKAQARQHLDDTLRPIMQDAAGKEADLSAFLVARREQQLRAQGSATKTDLTDGELARAVADGQRDPQIVNLADRVTAYYRDLLKKRLDVGLLTQDKYDAIIKSEDFYTPFVREWDGQGAGKGGNSAGKFVNRGSGVRTMDRAQMASAKITDPLEQAVLDGTDTFRQVAKQRVTNVVGDIVESNPNGVLGLLREVPAGTTPKPTARVVEPMVGGVRKRYEVTDPDFFDAWASFDKHSMGIAEQIGNYFKRSLQYGVTLLPDFAVANLLRDTGGAVIQQGARKIVKEAAGGAAAGFVVGAATADPDESRFVAGLKGAGYGAGIATVAPQFLRAMGAVKHIVADDAVYKDFLRSGASTDGFYPRNTDDARKVLDRLRKTGVSASDIINPKSWLDALHYIGNTMEQSTRLAKFTDVVGAGGTVPRAALESQDVSLRFANVGKRTKGISSVTAFWNAKVQGWDKLTRLIKDPRTAAAGVATITAPTMALWATNKDNPDYWERPQWERNMFWLLPKSDGGFYRIAKPFEIGFLFASLPERLADYAYQRQQGADAMPGESLGAAAKDMLATTFDGTMPIPTAIGLGLEQATNYSMFRGRPIVQRPELPRAMQQDERTSFIAKTLGERFNLSPQRIDHVVSSLTGSTGMVVSQVADQVARRTGADDRADPAEGVPVLARRFVTNDAGTTDQEQTIRRRWADADRVYQGARALERDTETSGGDPEKLRAYVEANRPMLEQRAQLERVVSALNEITGKRRALRKDRTVDRTTRKEQLQALRLLGQEIANFGLGHAPAAMTSQGTPP